MNHVIFRGAHTPKNKNNGPTHPVPLMKKTWSENASNHLRERSSITSAAQGGGGSEPKF